jgi:hypothetical protein
MWQKRRPKRRPQGNTHTSTHMKLAPLALYHAHIANAVIPTAVTTLQLRRQTCCIVTTQHAIVRTYTHTRATSSRRNDLIIHAGRPAQFAPSSESSLPRFWWRLDARRSDRSILLPAPFAHEFESQSLWAVLGQLVDQSTPEQVEAFLCAPEEWLSDGGIGPSKDKLAFSIPPVAHAITDVSLAHILACLPSLPYYAPIATGTGEEALFFHRDMSGSMHQVGDRIRITLRSLVKLLSAAREWETAAGCVNGSKSTARSLASASGRFNRLYETMLLQAPSLVPSRAGVELFRNFRRVSAMNARKRRQDSVTPTSAS